MKRGNQINRQKGKGGSYYPKSGKGNHAVVCVNWYGAVAFCEWLSEKIGVYYSFF